MIAAVESPSLVTSEPNGASLRGTMTAQDQLACQYTVYKSICDVDAEEWNGLRNASRDPFMDPGFIEAVENSMGSVCRFRHVVVRDKAGHPLAAACLSSYTVDGAALAEGSAKVILSAIGRFWPWLTRNTMVMCGLPISSGDSHLRFAPHADRASVLAILDRLIGEFAREERARFIIFKEFNADGARDLKGLESLGYRQADSYPMNYAVSDYRDFDDYLSRIRSKKRRMLRGSIRKFAKGNFRVVTLTGRAGAADHYTDRVHRLYEAVLSRSPVQFEHLPAEFLRELARQLPDNTSFTYVYRGDEVVAYSASVFSETTFHGIVLGIDYDLNREYELYFNVLFKALDVAFRRGAQEILLGQTADTTKHAKLDIFQGPMSIYVKGGRSTIRIALKLAFPLFFPPRPAAYLPESEDEATDAAENE
ncbi:MAG TPA: GNAT family N-acetyltransferase [Planctomycetaceae bacterium]|nr:GNAT family N-acetyltransferase [Planctomycetaceae bacterium]